MNIPETEPVRGDLQKPIPADKEAQIRGMLELLEHRFLCGARPGDSFFDPPVRRTTIVDVSGEEYVRGINAYISHHLGPRREW